MNKQLTFNPFGALLMGNLDSHSVLDIFEKAALYEEAQKENSKLVSRVSELEHQLAEAQLLGECFISPSFPEDFTSYANVGELRDDEIQELVNEVSSSVLQEGEFQSVALGDTVVIHMHDGDSIVTVVASNYFEYIEPIQEESFTCSGADDCTCFPQPYKFQA